MHPCTTAETPPAVTEGQSMKLYLAARFGRQAELRRYRTILEHAGHEVTSSWLDSKKMVTKPGDCRIWAEDDLRDLIEAEGIILWSENPKRGWLRGGRHTEFGYALNAGLKCFVIGPRENIFHYLHDVHMFSNLQDCIKYMAKL